MDIQVELLLGRKVHDAEGEYAGRIEEFRAKRDGTSCLVEAYLIGASALLERLSAWTLVRPTRRAMQSRVYTIYRVPWQDMDLSDPEQPRLRIPKRDLRHAK